MAKSSKLEDYWRKHDIENLLKELTQVLSRRTPDDPAVAIVEHIQKKFPQSFKASTENTATIKAYHDSKPCKYDNDKFI